MKTLYINGEYHGQAERIFVDSSSIVGKNGDAEVFAIRGVKFENITYEIEDEQGAPASYDVDEEEQKVQDLEQAIAELSILIAGIAGGGV